jgi:hypothetical protein
MLTAESITFPQPHLNIFKTPEGAMQVLVTLLHFNAHISAFRPVFLVKETKKMKKGMKRKAKVKDTNT